MWVIKIFEMRLDSRGREKEKCVSVIPLPDWVRTENEAVEWSEVFQEVLPGQFLEVSELFLNIEDADIPRL